MTKKSTTNTHTKPEKTMKTDEFLRYTQSSGFERYEVEAPSEIKTLPELFKHLGFRGGSDEGEGTVGLPRGTWDLDPCVEHYYGDGKYITVLDGVNHFHVIFTESEADFIALRIALAPLATVTTLESLLLGLLERNVIGADSLRKSIRSV